MTTRPGYVWDATASEWVEIGQAAVLAPIAYQTSAPSSPATGDIWIDSDDEVPSVDSTLYYRWTKTMSGGETSLSGTDDNSLALKYTPGYESVFINGVLQVRGSDYVATTGTTVTGLTALTASDIVMVESIIAYSVGDTYTQTTLDGKFSPITTTGLVLLNSTAFTAQSSVQVDNCFTSTYDNYKILFELTSVSGTNVAIRSRLVDGTTPSSTAAYNFLATGIQNNGTANNLTSVGQTSFQFLVANSTVGVAASFDFVNPQLAKMTQILFNSYNANGSVAFSYAGAAQFEATTQFEGIQFFPASGTMTGTIKVYGYK
jgi:hypothetical protein